MVWLKLIKNNNKNSLLCKLCLINLLLLTLTTSTKNIRTIFCWENKTNINDYEIPLVLVLTNAIIVKTLF